MKQHLDKGIREYLTKIGREGGKARARNHSKEELSEWAKKGGGRPKKAFHELSASGRYARKRRERKRELATGGK